MPSKGNFTALVVLVQFPDHVDDGRILPSPEYFRNLCQTNVKRYLQLQSYGQYHLDDCIVTDWLVTNGTEAFFAAGIANRKAPELAAGFAVAALDQFDATDPDYSILDVDDDGALDCVLLIHSGYASERSFDPDCPSGQQPADRIQSMAGPSSNGAWFSRNFNTTNQIYLSGYAIASAFDTTCQNTPALMGVMTHELLHLFDTPDLYDPNKFVGGLGHFDIMSNPEGAVPGFVPGSASPYTKLGIGWMEATEITSDGVYTLQTSNLYPECFVIREGYGPGEYLLIENRYLLDFDEQLPGTGGGLLIYHIDEQVWQGQARPGWPDLPDYPHSHYSVALLQADGNYDLEKGWNSGDAGDYFTDQTRGLLPGSFGFSPNSDSYQFGMITETGISITEITAPAVSVSFRVSGLGEAPSASPVERHAAVEVELRPTLSSSAATWRWTNRAAAVWTVLSSLVWLF